MGILLGHSLKIIKWTWWFFPSCNLTPTVKHKIVSRCWNKVDTCISILAICKLTSLEYFSSNVNEVTKRILDFFIQKNSFLNGSYKLVFVCEYGSTIIGVVGPPYPYCSLVAFCAFAWLRLCAFSAFGAWKIFS